MGSLKPYIVTIAAVAFAILVLELLGPWAVGATAAEVLLLVILFGARFYGTGPALVASVCAAIGFSYYFITPVGYALGDPNDWVAFAAFILVAFVGGELAARAERRAAEAQEGRQEIARLYQELQLAFDRASEAEAARRNEELKAALLDALTHNLRTPLTAIKAAVTALTGAKRWGDRSPISTEDQHELLEVIDQESDRLNRFIEGLSAAGTTDSTHPLKPRIADAREIVQTALTRAETVLRDHRLEVRMDEHLPALSVDAASIIEVLYILLDNASKYAPLHTTIQLAVTRSDEQYVGLVVSDEGPGIPSELRERVFEKFFRVPAREAHDPRRGGAGLGLPIAKRLVEAQAGRIWIDVPPAGYGTAVHLTLPVAAATRAEPQPAAATVTR